MRSGRLSLGKPRLSWQSNCVIKFAGECNIRAARKALLKCGLYMQSTIAYASTGLYLVWPDHWFDHSGWPQMLARMDRRRFEQRAHLLHRMEHISARVYSS